MPLTFKSDANLTRLNTLAITAKVDYLAPITSVGQLSEAVSFAKQKQLPLWPLGDGSNIVIGRNQLHCIALKIKIPGIDVIEKTDKYTRVRAGAGENWDKLVRWSVKRNLRGIESLSIIPGTVGAAPVQNVGAYGQEVSETIIEVEVYDIRHDRVRMLSNADCHFAYRDSIFKHEGKNRYVVTAVSFQLAASELAPPPKYASLQAELDRRKIAKPTVAEIRESVMAIRTSKLPDPKTTPTAGSFFHNPVVPAATLQLLQKQYPEIPHWPAGQGKVKLSASWLVEQCGFKGHLKNGVGIYPKQAIALINPGHKPAHDVLAFRDEIIAAVRNRFGITLNMEPELITF